jgi:hypothetical protein
MLFVGGKRLGDVASIVLTQRGDPFKLTEESLSVRESLDARLTRC